MANIGNLTAYIDADTQGLERGLDRATKATGRYRDAAGRMREANGKFVSSANAAGGAIEQTGRQATNAAASFASLKTRIAQVSGLLASIGVGFGIGAIVNQFADFEQGMRNVAAVSGSTAEELARLEESALRAAASTRFNPRQTTQALYALASSGQAAQEQISTLPNVLNLAEAGQADLGRATELLTSTLNQFSLQANDSQRVADVFVASIGASALNVDRLQVAFRNAGPTAAALGQSLEQTTAALGSLTTAFGNGERAGTGLRAILTELPDNAEDLGISVKDANGNFLGMVDILRQMEKQGITTNQVVEMFGAEAGPALAALLSQGSDALEKMEGRIASTGQAAETAGKQLDTLRGDLDAFSSAVSVAFVEMGDSQSGLLRSTVQTTTNLIRLWSGYGDELGDARQSTELLAGAIEVAAIAISARLVSALATAGATMLTTAAAAGTLRTALLGINPILTVLVGGAGLLYTFREELGLVPGPAKTVAENVDEISKSLDGLSDSLLDVQIAAFGAELVQIELQAERLQGRIESLQRTANDSASFGQGQQGDIRSGLTRAQAEQQELSNRAEAINQAISNLDRFRTSSDEAATGSERLGKSTNNAADALDKFSASLTPEVEDILERAGPGATIDEQGQIRDAFGNFNRILQRELESAVGGQLRDFQNEQNLQAGLDSLLASMTGGATSSGGIMATGSQSSIPALASGKAANDAMAEPRKIGTLTFNLKGDGEDGSTDVTGDANDLKRLADLFSGVAASS